MVTDEQSTIPPLVERLAVMRDGITFASCLAFCVENKEFVENYDRLRGTNLSLKGPAILVEIDRVSGRIESELRDFIDFCWDGVFLRFS